MRGDLTHCETRHTQTHIHAEAALSMTKVPLVEKPYVKPWVAAGEQMSETPSHLVALYIPPIFHERERERETEGRQAIIIPLPFVQQRER